MDLELNVDRPLLLDLFCCAGGASMGYHRAGFTVIGVDVKPQPHYPFEFHLDDAIEFAGKHGHEFAVIAASPPCQKHTPMSNRWRGKGTVADTHTDLIPATRDVLAASGRPYIIENVAGARKALRMPLLLHGAMFGLGVHRPRLFESNVSLAAPPFKQPVDAPVGIYGPEQYNRQLWTRRNGTELRSPSCLDEAQRAMGIDWMDWDELREAIPPAYTEYLGKQIIGACEPMVLL